MAQELASAKAQLEPALSEQRQEMTDLALENERHGSDIEERSHSDIAMRAELATLQGRIEDVADWLLRASQQVDVALVAKSSVLLEACHFLDDADIYEQFDCGICGRKARR